MPTSPLEQSARYIDENLYEGAWAVNRVSMNLSEVAPGVAIVEAFSHVVAFDVGDELVVFDCSLEPFHRGVLGALRGWSDKPVHTIAYTHGHIDHVGGARAFVEEARERGHRDPQVVAHNGVLARFDRYARTNAYNLVVNRRQFATLGGGILGDDSHGRFGPKHWVRPDLTFEDRTTMAIGNTAFHLRHDRGETDDHLWAWVPQHRALVTGDFVTWVFPNAGNPQKVQRYPAEWARALRTMAGFDAELLLPAHGLPIAGRERIAQVLGDLATVLESLVEQTLSRMNAGLSLDDVLHEVSLPDDLMGRPYLRAVYDEPEFVVRNIWRLYGGWYDGNPARLKPPPDQVLAEELAELCGGARKLADRARSLQPEQSRLACALVELASQADPDDAEIHAARSTIYGARREAELSLMAKGIFGAAARDSDQRRKAIEDA